ncbi:MAG: hypothetical protein MMC33_003281 [Icmadophila ericetorum]|nr:hypothetical protein [Icmadophila ericetorum]
MAEPNHMNETTSCLLSRRYKLRYDSAVDHHSIGNHTTARSICLIILHDPYAPAWYRVASSLLLAYTDYHPRNRVEYAVKIIDETESRIRANGKKLGPIMAELRSWADRMVGCVVQKEDDEDDEGDEDEGDESGSEGSMSDWDDGEPGLGNPIQRLKQTELSWYGKKWEDLLIYSIRLPSVDLGENSDADYEDMPDLESSELEWTGMED